MAINKITAPLSTSPSVFATPVVNQLLALVLGIDRGERVVNGYVKKGAMFNLLGDIFIADSDTQVSGTESGSVAIRFSVSGNVATAMYVSSLPTVSWNDAYQGVYDSTNNMYFTDYIYPGDKIYQSFAGPSSTQAFTNAYMDNASIVVPRTAKWRIRLELGCASYSGGKNYRTYARMYKNGTLFGSEHSITETSYKVVYEDILCNKNDVIVVQTKSLYDWSQGAYNSSDNPGTAYIRNLGLANALLGSSIFTVG